MDQDRGEGDGVHDFESISPFNLDVLGCTGPNLTLRPSFSRQQTFLHEHMLLFT